MIGFIVGVVAGVVVAVVFAQVFEEAMMDLMGIQTGGSGGGFDGGSQGIAVPALIILFFWFVSALICSALGGLAGAGLASALASRGRDPGGGTRRVPAAEGELAGESHDGINGAA